MVLGRAFRPSACASCRLALLRSFTSISGPSIRVPRHALRNPKYPTSIQQFRRLIQDDHSPPIIVGERSEHEIQEEEHADAEVEEGSIGTQVSAIPWYLQVDSPERTPPPTLSERQQIPELPEKSPPILLPLLQHISIDLGLDDLSLLDLRKLDPPPALGANLLMVLGTARSEKHLHVSADRLCRWLRSEYKLRPDADGLLGRNELKLKLKRKAKRAKLVGSADENEDDGVRTGWVCVDVGVVEGGEVSTVPERNDFVGFGRRTDGVRIVVQMLTEEKREEIDLERLWSGILKRGTQEIMEDLDTETEKLEGENPIASPRLHTTEIPRKTGPTSQLGQTRSFHSGTRSLISESNQHTRSSLQISKLPSSSRENNITETLSGEELLRNIEDYLHDARKRQEVSIPLEQIQTCCQHHPKLIPDIQNLLKTDLEGSTPKQVLEKLGAGSKDPLITDFMKAVLVTTPHRWVDSKRFQSLSDFDFRIWILEFTWPHYSNPRCSYLSRDLEILSFELRMCGIEVPLAMYLRLLRLRLGFSCSFDQHALTIIQDIHDRGYDLLQEEILVFMQEALFAPESASTKFNEGFPSPSQERLHSLILQLDLPLFSEKGRMRLMKIYSELNLWTPFWDVFRMAAKRNRPQSAKIYSFMFQKMAASQSQKLCVDVIRDWLPEMESEKPTIRREEVWDGLKACLLVADPYVEQEATSSPDMKGEWVAIWKKYSGLQRHSEPPSQRMYDQEGNRVAGGAHVQYNM